VSTESASKQPTSTRQRARTAVLICVAILVTLFAALNTESVEVNWIIGKGTAPLIIVIALSFLIGIVFCYLVERLRSRRGGRS